MTKDLDIPDELFARLEDSYFELYGILRITIKFDKVGEKYDLIVSVLVLLILMLSFFGWVLIILGII
jgi:hypothetical protein